ncbi:MAG: phosphoserine phosphatase SerB [Gammaproteobacteria bacterium]|nr:MAG: phosphoserine phosphatase SerB [Gammaproteobacteria bacterium]
MTTLILQGTSLTDDAAAAIASSVSGELSQQARYQVIETNQTVSAEQLTGFRADNAFDINQLPDGFVSTQARLLVTDMDSTLINIECVDEIADFINVKPQVAEITEAAMRGEIDFETSLRQRVALLKGLDVSALERVYMERLQLNPGASVMLDALQQANIKTALVSGGFTFFTERLKQRLGLDFTMANVLGEHKGKLTGEVEGDICGAQAKADFLLDHCDKLNISANQVISMGDGANDLLMMKEAGLSIAYHAKPTVQQQAATSLNHCGLDGVVGLLQLS